MKVLLLLTTVILPTQLAALGVEGVWESGERFRAEILYEHGTLPFPKHPTETSAPVLSDKFPQVMQHAEVALRIYNVEEDGSETLAFEKLRLYSVFDSGNQSISRVGIGRGQNGTLLVKQFRSVLGKNAGVNSITIAKHGDQFVVQNYSYTGDETIRLHASNGSSTLISRPLKCNVDLSTGQRVIDGQTDAIDQPGVIRLEDWNTETAHQLNLCPLE